MTTARPPSKSQLSALFRAKWNALTESEQRVATYILANVTSIPFETGSSIASNVGVSKMTVSRFFRKLGFENLGSFKRVLRERNDNWINLYRTPEGVSTSSMTEDLVREQVKSSRSIIELKQDPEWQHVITLLSSSSEVLIVSFQLGRFMGMTLGSLLAHVRPHVRTVGCDDGTYSEILQDTAKDGCVVLVDERRYSSHFFALAEEVSARKLKLVIITDTDCYWARKFTSHVIMIPTRVDRPWHDFSPMIYLFSLLISDVISVLGDAVYKRIMNLNDLRSRFIPFR